MPITQIAGQMNLLQSGLASAERVFEFLDAAEETPDRCQREPVAARSHAPEQRGRWSTSRSATSRTSR